MMTAATKPHEIPVATPSVAALRAGETGVARRPGANARPVVMTARPMAEIPARADDLPTNQPLVVICHHGVAARWSSIFSETPALTTQSTSTAA